MSNNTETYIIKLKDRGVVEGLKKAGVQVDRVDKKVNGLNTAFKTFGGILAGVSIGALGMEVVDTLAKFEKFEAVLTNTLGSNGAAKQILADITDFASKTPFQVDGLTDSFVRLANQGFTPTMAQMTKLGDIAASKGKDMTQLSEALIDAEVGEFERLKEFGIRASKNGDKVAFSFKGMTKEVDFTNEAIRGYILSLGEAEGVSGAMASISKTTGGQISNLKDKVTQLYLNIGEKLKPEIGALIAGLSDTVGALMSAVNWLSSGSTSAEIFIAVVSALTAGIVLYNGVQKAQILWTQAATAAQWLWNAALTANPIGLVIAGVAALVAGVYVAWKRFDKFRAVIKGTWAALKSVGTSIKSYFLGLPELIVKAFSAIPKAIGQIFQGVGSVIKAVVTGNFKAVPDLLKKLVTGNAVAGVVKDFAKDRIKDGKNAANAFNDAYNAEMSASAKAKAQKEADEKAVNDQKVDFTPTTSPSGTKSSKLGAGLSEVRASAPKTFNINIESLIKEQNINTTNLRESTQKIKEEITRVLLTAVNDSQIIAE